MKKKTFGFVFATAIALASACGDDGIAGDGDGDGDCTVTPGDWTAPNFAANTTTEIAVRAQVDDLAGGLMRDAEQDNATVDEVADLTALYEAGDTSVASIVSAELDAAIQDSFADFVAVMAAGPQDLFNDNSNSWTPGADGGIYGTSERGINTGGIEVRQIVDKSLHAGFGYHHALTLTEGTINEATIDAIAAAWGSNATLDPTDRNDSADYAFDMGFHATIAGALTDAKAYAADPNCGDELQTALVTVFDTWEKALFARVVFYANAGATEMAAAADDDTRAGALHEYAEGLGLAAGFYGIPDPSAGPLMSSGRVITDAEIEALMSTLGVDINDLSASTIGSDFAVNPTQMATEVTAAETSLMTIFGFSQADIEGFRSPTEG